MLVVLTDSYWTTARTIDGRFATVLNPVRTARCRAFAGIANARNAIISNLAAFAVHTFAASTSTAIEIGLIAVLYCISTAGGRTLSVSANLVLAISGAVAVGAFLAGGTTYAVAAPAIEVGLS